MKKIFFVALLVILAVVLLVWFKGTHEDFVSSGGASVEAGAEVARGEYLVRAADCAGCHTRTSQAPFAGDRLIRTPFGDLITPNITPDLVTGIGQWSSDDFWRALHNGKSRDGRLLYPAFPFPDYTNVSREDADAMFAYLKSVTPIRHAVSPTRLRFPFDQRLLLVAWRALYFRPGVYEPDALQSSQWNRGAYLVKGLGHCDACHADRNLLGATEPRHGLDGAQIPIIDWYAPSLADNSELGLKDWPPEDLERLLGTGISDRSAVFGPMAEVVQRSTQYMTSTDLAAMANYLGNAPAGRSKMRSGNDAAKAASSDVASELALGFTETIARAATKIMVKALQEFIHR